ncbi:hypothetical protein MIDIC_500032 [Alphaproteobacteria bacterium]
MKGGLGLHEIYNKMIKFSRVTSLDLPEHGDFGLLQKNADYPDAKYWEKYSVFCTQESVDRFGSFLFVVASFFMRDIELQAKNLRNKIEVQEKIVENVYDIVPVTGLLEKNDVLKDLAKDGNDVNLTNVILFNCIAEKLNKTDIDGVGAKRIFELLDVLKEVQPQLPAAKEYVQDCKRALIATLILIHPHTLKRKIAQQRELAPIELNDTEYMKVPVVKAGLRNYGKITGTDSLTRIKEFILDLIEKICNVYNKKTGKNSIDDMYKLAEGNDVKNTLFTTATSGRNLASTASNLK